ncbi:ATP-binding protein [Murinocardiopsis flavida]|nr:ATP-binding protein [Murinocardiopsis flavida]
MNDFFRWPLLRLAEDFLRQFQFRNTEEEMDFGLQRVALPEYSEIAFREALANTFIHRDYSRRGAVHVQWHDEDLEISSPGGFPEGVRLDNILVTPPHPRNPVLADAFKRARLVERTGRGINRMFEQQLRFGRSAPEYGRTTETAVVAVLPGEPANLAVTRFVLEQDRADQSLKLPDLQLLNELTREREVSTSEAAGLIQMSEDQAKRVLRRMTERGWIEARGATQNRVYHLSGTVYRQLGDSAGYVRLKGFEPIRQEQMVLQLLQANDEVSSSDVAQLCQLNPWQARTLLTRLIKEGKVTRHGEGRWTRYRLAPRPHSR